jgi:glutathione synthase/RimK-type ligase-like ATP-grasp enzyme
MKRSTMKKIALATSMLELPASDRVLASALSQSGFDVKTVLWSAEEYYWKQFDAVIVRSCWNYHLHLEKFLEWIGGLEKSELAVFNTPDLIRWNANKLYLSEVSAVGIEIPDTIFLSNEEQADLSNICVSRGWNGAVIKPLVSAGSHMTERRETGLVRGPAIVQEYVESIQSDGEWSLIYIASIFSHAVRKRPSANDFRVQRKFGGTVELIEPTVEMRRFAERVLENLRWPALFARVDLISVDSSLRLMELEVIEPDLFLDLAPKGARQLASQFAVCIEEARNYRQ